MGIWGLTSCVTTSYHCVGCHTIWHLVSLIAHPMLPSVVIVNIGKYNISQRPDEAMLFVMVKACLCLKKICYSEP